MYLKSILIFISLFIYLTNGTLLPPDSLDCCVFMPRIVNDTIIKKCVDKMIAMDKKNKVQRPNNAPPGGLCLIECFINETKLAVKGDVTTDTVQKSLYGLLNTTNVRMWKPLIDKYVPKCVSDYQTFKADASKNMTSGSKSNDCCPSSGYLMSRIMGEFFIHCPDFNSKVPKCNLYSEQVKKTAQYVVAQDLTAFIKS